MGAMLGRIVSDYDGLVKICQQRAAELEISRSGIDYISGLTTGHAGKILGSKQKKKMGPVSLGLMLETLGLKLLIIEDEAATARTLALRKPVQISNQRLGNRSNSKPLCIESAEPVKIAAPKNEPPAPASRVHLRVIQSKPKGRVYGRRRYG